MASIKCFCDVGEGPQDLNQILDQVSECLLTTDHSRSCYGLPVVVGPSGTTYGPSEIRGKIACDVTCDDDLALVRAAHAAGYRIGYDLPDDQIGGSCRHPITGQRS